MNQHNKSFLRRVHEDQSGRVMGLCVQLSWQPYCMGLWSALG